MQKQTFTHTHQFVISISSLYASVRYIHPSARYKRVCGKRRLLFTRSWAIHVLMSCWIHRLDNPIISDYMNCKHQPSAITRQYYKKGKLLFIHKVRPDLIIRYVQLNCHKMSLNIKYEQTIFEGGVGWGSILVEVIDDKNDAYFLYISMPYEYVWVCMSVYASVCLYVYVCAYFCMSMIEYACVRVWLCMHVCVFVRVCVCMLVIVCPMQLHNLIPGIRPCVLQCE